ncbi:carboxylesterase type B [Fusarium beomiforme]|uniref:Carboxylesterase type B n=1 Tax=Fusarium beomiforme TaxID=44412 RepID=A0A9P5AMQ8_9HYPO|nr:carboxylesterase type B [Fusarium beomiforme]
MTSRILALLLSNHGAVTSKDPTVDLDTANRQQETFGSRNLLPPKDATPPSTKGDVGRICPQAMAAWEVYTSFTGRDFLSGEISALTANQKHALEKPSGLEIPSDPRENEDCLFLDVVTPIETFESPIKILAPVVFWLSGGGYRTGEKGWLDPAGLIKASYTSSPEGLVFVQKGFCLAGLELSEVFIGDMEL